MSIQIGGGGHAIFQGRFTFGYIPPEVETMLFTIPPVNASNIHVAQDGVALPWTLAATTYPSVLPAYPSLSMIKWSGPFPESGALFEVGYEHAILAHGNERVFFYSLGTGKYFPTYDKITTAVFDIAFPSSLTLTACSTACRWAPRPTP